MFGGAVALLLLLLPLLSPSVRASTLILPDHGLGPATYEDSSDLTTGGGSPQYSVAGSCSYNTYYDTCPSVADGGRISRSDFDGSTYILRRGEVVHCGRYRTESVCNMCNFLGCTTTTSTKYGGSVVYYPLTYEAGSVAALSLSREVDGACVDACTSPDGGVVVSDGVGSCASVRDGGGGTWYYVDDDYDERCPTRQTCDRLVVHGGCEGSEVGSVAGTYEPVDADSDECGNLDDTSHSRYKKVSGGDNGFTYYLFRDGSEWRFQRTDCTDSPYFNSRGTFEAGDEPFLDAEDTVGCYDGGNGSDKRYTYTDLSLECKKIGSGGGGGDGLVDGKPPVGVDGGVVVGSAPEVEDYDDVDADVDVDGATSVGEFCADLGPVEEHMVASLEDIIQYSLTGEYECGCTIGPDDGGNDASFEVYCSIEYGDRNSYANFERATFAKTTVSSKLLVPVSFSWGDTSYGTDVGEMQETYYYEGGEAGSYRPEGCAVPNGCASCEICPDGASTAIDCYGLSSGLGYGHTCDDRVTTTTFLASYFENNGLVLVTDRDGPSPYGVFGSSGAERGTGGKKMSAAAAAAVASWTIFSFGGL